MCVAVAFPYALQHRISCESVPHELADILMQYVHVWYMFGACAVPEVS